MDRDRPNILFIIMDTARARTVLETDELMPNLQRIADDGTLFTNAYTTAPWTLPSHASVFTGQYTSDHGTHAGTKRFDPDVPTLAERLQTEGYQTIAYSNNTWVSSEFGFDRGFEEFKVGWKLFEGGADIATIAKKYNSPRERAAVVSKELLKRNGHRTLGNGLYAKLLRKRYDDGAKVTNWRMRRWLSKHRDADRPFFAFINYLEPHLKYEPPKEHCEPYLPNGVDYATAMEVNQDAWGYICGTEEMTDEDFDILQSLYKGEISYLDERIGELYECLDCEGLLENTMVVIAGDHGENLGEHGLMDHQYCLYDTLLHVPLVVQYPDQFPAGETCEELAELRDILPTLMRTAGADVPERDDIASHTLQDAIENEGREYVIGEYIQPQPSMEELERRTGFIPDDVREYDRGLRSVRTDQWKYIERTDGSVELYNVSFDRRELENIAGDHEERTDYFNSILDSQVGSFGNNDHEESDTEMKDETRKRLQDLGYL